MKKVTIKSKVCYLLSAAMGGILILSSCSSDEVEALIKDETVNVSGTVSSASAGLGGVKVKGIYSDNDVLNPETTTATDGTFTLTVLKDIAVSLQASASNYVTLNSEKTKLSVDETGLDIELPTSTDAEAAINQVFPGQTIVGSAWLVVNVVNSSDVEVGGVAISTTGTPTDTAATNCDGTDSNGNITIASCSPDRDGPMYFAYFDTESAEVTVTAGADSQLAPVRRGEVTFLEFVQ